MKKHLFLIGLIFTMFVAYPQTTETKSEPQPTATADSIDEPQDDFCPHRILFRVGGGYANNMFKKLFEDYKAKRCSYTAMAEIGYTYFFHRNVGIGIGVGINHLARAAKITDSGTDIVTEQGYNNEELGDLFYRLTYSLKGFKQIHTTWALEVPLTIQFEKKWGKHGIYAAVGAKGYFPFIGSKVSYKDQKIDLISIYDIYANCFMDKLDVHLDPVVIPDGRVIKPKMKPSVDVLAEFGGIFGLSRAVDLYVGAYGSYGFINILPKGGIDLSNMEITHPVLSQVIGNYINTSEKWNTVMVGIKLGFHFKVCKSCRNDKYMRDEKRDFMDEMKKKQKEPVIVTNTVEYYYFVPQISQELLDESAEDPNKKKVLMDLAQALSNIKILFDLDKDIPKLNDYKREHIDRASKLLRENQDLKVIISGYTSPEGTRPHNQDLGHRRALAVREIFINKGVPADQIAVQNFTAEDPQHRIDIPEKEYPEQRAVIFKIEKRY
jgi:outer membrane protein OmpA-like peptidoglycan-associated protein